MNVVEMYLKNGLTNKKLNQVKGIVIHWFASPMAKAENVIKYWESQANGVSTQYVICLDGTLYHAVPDDMVAYQVGCPRGYTKEAIERLSSYPNNCVIGIECAHVDMTGKMTDATYKTLVEHSAALLKKFNLTVNDLWLHSEIVGKDYKDCHRWFTTTKPSDWQKFKDEVNAILNPPKPVETTQEQQGDEVMKLSKTFYDIVLAELQDATDEQKYGKNALNKIWVDKLVKNELTCSDAIGILFTLRRRGI